MKKKPFREPPDKTTFETFRPIEAFEMRRMQQNEPSCFNGCVSVRRYRISCELIEEPSEVLEERLRKLWRTSDNFHHREPLREAAERVGVVLDASEFGRDREKR